MTDLDFENFKLAIASHLREIRQKCGLTQGQASGAEMDLRSYQRLESGENGISLKSIYLLSKRFNIHPSEFFNIRLSNQKSTKKD